MTAGTIAKIAEGRGFGFIESSDGQYFFHCSSLDQTVAFDGLHIGQRVTFEPTPGAGRGPRAEYVRLEVRS